MSKLLRRKLQRQHLATIAKSIERIAESMDTASDDCVGCGRPHYKNFAEVQSRSALMGAVTRIKNAIKIMEQGWKPKRDQEAKR